jgi:hypothetical protein
MRFGLDKVLIGVVWLLFIFGCMILPASRMTMGRVRAYGMDNRTAPSTNFSDPDIVDSEWNHRLAGYILLGIAFLVLAGHHFPSQIWLQRLWPFLFVGAALFLAVWSDKEIWPRGPLSWTWLIHHDAEARQHKIYAILLLAMGILEYFRSCGKLREFWRTWAFPALAVIGACLLLVHDHGGSSGLPPGWDSAEKLARIAKMTGAPPPMFMHPDSMQTKHSSPAMSEMDPQSENGHHEHLMTSSMLHVKEQHLWFTFVGVAVALFKFIHDGSFWRRRFVPYLWPGATCVLGILLALYTEVQ